MTTRRTIVLVASALVALALVSCGGSNNGSKTGSGADKTADDHAGHDHAAHAGGDAGSGEQGSDLYEGILGEIVAMPGERPDGDMRIRHEHIPGFKNELGEIPVTPDGIPGMKSMEMPFPLAQGVSLDGFGNGDKVRFAFRVNWGGTTPWELTAIEKVDPDTEIDYSNTTRDDAEP